MNENIRNFLDFYIVDPDPQYGVLIGKPPIQRKVG